MQFIKLCYFKTHAKEGFLDMYMGAELFHSWEKVIFYLYLYPVMHAVVCLCVLFICNASCFSRAPENVLHDFTTVAHTVGSGPTHPSAVIKFSVDCTRSIPCLSFILHGAPSSNCSSVPVIARLIAGSHTLFILVNNDAVIFTVLWNLCFQNQFAVSTSSA